jgi:uncharacterized coiled-coil protein SlyX
MLNGIRKWLTLAAAAMLTLTLVPTDGRCQESCSVFQVLIDLARPQPPKKPQVIGIVVTPHCPMGVCSGAACPSYCRAHCGTSAACPACPEGVMPAGCGMMTGAACASCAVAPCACCASCPTQCRGAGQECRTCCQDCPHGCGGRCEVCPGCAIDRVSVAVRSNERLAEERRTERLHRLCMEQEQTIRQLAEVVSEMQKELTALRHEMANMRNVVVPMPPPNFVPVPMPYPTPMPHYSPNGTAPSRYHVMPTCVPAMPPATMPAVKPEMLPRPLPSGVE